MQVFSTNRDVVSFHTDLQRGGETNPHEEKNAATVSHSRVETPPSDGFVQKTEVEGFVQKTGVNGFVQKTGVEDESHNGHARCHQLVGNFVRVLALLTLSTSPAASSSRVRSPSTKSVSSTKSVLSTKSVSSTPTRSTTSSITLAPFVDSSSSSTPLVTPLIPLLAVSTLQPAHSPTVPAFGESLPPVIVIGDATSISEQHNTRETKTVAHGTMNARSPVHSTKVGYSHTKRRVSSIRQKRSISRLKSNSSSGGGGGSGGDAVQYSRQKRRKFAQHSHVCEIGSVVLIASTNEIGTIIGGGHGFYHIQLTNRDHTVCKRSADLFVKSIPGNKAAHYKKGISL